MSKYFLVTILSKGKKSQIPLYAKDKKQANQLAKLKNSGIVIKIEEAKEPLELQFQRFKKNFLKNIKKRKIKQDSLISAIRQLAVMTKAGLSINDSLNEIASSTDDANLAYIFKIMAIDINSGFSLSKTMEKFRFELGNLTLAIVKLGEQTGNIDQALFTLADMLEEIRTNIVKFKKAMNYPRNVMIAMAIAFTILLSYVVPQFKTIFESLNTELPLPTVILLTMEHLINSYGVYILSLFTLLFFTAKYFINHNKNVKYRWHQLLLRTVVIKDVILYSTLNRFTLVFSELIKAGIPISEALDTSISMIDNLELQNKLYSVIITVEKGGTLQKGLEETKLFENMIIKMIRAGEESGQLDAMMINVRDYYKMRFDGVIDGLSSAIEPLMLIIIASLVLLLALGIFMPMWDMGNAVQGR